MNSIAIVTSLFSPGTDYTIENNIIHFIHNETDRPAWSKALERSYSEFGEVLDMSKNYDAQQQAAQSNKALQEYFGFITEKGGIILDLASGPSGYFAPALDRLQNGSVFIGSDACTTVVRAHSKANTNDNFFIIDADLDKSLPFQSGCLDVVCGNLLDNVNNYRELISEAYRCLKHGGKFAVIELFFEKDSQTYGYLMQQNAVYSSLKTYIDYCSTVGFKYLGGKILKETIGKIDKSDILPIRESDKSVVRTVYFEK